MKFLTNFFDLARTTFGQGITHGGLRDMWAIFGYPDDITIKDFRNKYQRGDIATRIVDAYPNACWSNQPFLVEDEDDQELTQWESEAVDFFKAINFWQHIRKLDRLVNLGSYAVLYLGFKDGSDLSNKVNPGTELAYIKALAEDVALVDSLVDDVTDPRFGLPLTYKIQLKKDKDTIVHYSRVIHVAERTIDDESKGQGILYSIWNKLIDLEKLSGGSAEVFWLNARAGLSIEVDADTDIGDDADYMKEQVDKFQHNLSRVMRTKGVKVNTLSQTVASPEHQFDLCISLIAGTTAIPKRILLGNEAGELASTQDENNWNNQIKDRQANFCEPHILNKFIDYMIELGNLKALGAGKKYSWEWPSLVSLSEKDKAEIGNKKAASLVAYANSPEADQIITPKQFVEEILEMEYREDEVAKIIAEENAAIDKQLELDQKELDL